MGKRIFTDCDFFPKMESNMKNNQHGFTYPLTLCILLLFLIFFSMHIDQSLSEQRMEEETTALLRQEYYFLSTAKKIELLYQTKGTIPSKGTFVYMDGTMDYRAESPSAYLQIVDFTLIIPKREPVVGFGYFDTRSRSLIKWVQVN